KGAKKDRDNPFAKNRYATLDAVLEAIADPLCDNGLVLTQWVGQVIMDGEGKATVSIYTRIEHAETSEYMQVSVTMPVIKVDPQGIGSAITYGRRYTLKPVLAIPEV